MKTIVQGVTEKRFYFSQTIFMNEGILHILGAGFTYTIERDTLTLTGLRPSRVKERNEQNERTTAKFAPIHES